MTIEAVVFYFFGLLAGLVIGRWALGWRPR
jgi:hypothetical protein